MIKRGYEDFPNNKIFLGIDEVGYGSCAGPLVLCGVILPNEIKSSLLIDSKKLSEQKRNDAVVFLEDKCDYFLANASVAYINKYGIVDAISKCVNEILEHYKNKFDLVLMDGTNWYGDKSINYKCIPKGDNTYQEIAAASIIAKVKRDEYMVKLDNYIPGYSFGSNKGYLTESHRQSLINLGVSPYHRLKYVNTWLEKNI